MIEISEIGPAAVPSDNELVLPADPAFEQECMAAISEDIERFGYRLKNSLMTKSEEWGLIWRVDFETPGVSFSTGFINRLTFWRPSDAPELGMSIVFGQRISPF
jgi:hypothetical protein